MAAKVGNSSGGPSADINMTPMIDIMLVLLIIFMVVQQGMQKGVSVQVPPVKTEDVAIAQSLDQIVLEVQPGHQFLLNQQPIAAAELVKELKDVFDPRPRKVIFVKGAETVSYGDVIFAVDAARAAGLEIVGLVPRT